MKDVTFRHLWGARFFTQWYSGSYFMSLKDLITFAWVRSEMNNFSIYCNYCLENKITTVIWHTMKQWKKTYVHVNVVWRLKLWWDVKTWKTSTELLPHGKPQRINLPSLCVYGVSSSWSACSNGLEPAHEKPQRINLLSLNQHGAEIEYPTPSWTPNTWIHLIITMAIIRYSLCSFL